jgi:hypothetical protein
MEPEEAAAMKAVAARLRRRYPEVPGEEIDRALAVAHRAYDGRPIRHFVPIFVERDVVDTLTAASRARAALDAVLPRQRTGSGPTVPA